MDVRIEFNCSWQLCEKENVLFETDSEITGKMPKKGEKMQKYSPTNQKSPMNPTNEYQQQNSTSPKKT